MKEEFEKIRNEVRVLSEQEFCKRRKQEECDKYVDCETCLIDSVLSIVSEVEAEYEGKFVHLGTYEQVAWERDVAVAQLKELGYSFGEKIRKVEAEFGKDINVRGNGWIDVKDRLPEKDGYYLTCDHKGNIHVFFHSQEFKETAPFGICEHHSRYYQPIAWMELPNPYTGKKGE